MNQLEEIAETVKMSVEETTEAINQIKALVIQTAEAKIKIGEILNNCKSRTPHGGMKSFYKSIGIKERTAQYYMQMASNKTVQMLKSKNRLDGLNMSEILKLVGMRVNVRGVNNEDTPQQQQEYTPKGFGQFEFNKCRSTKEFKIEYKALADKVSELETKLAEYEAKTA